MFNGQGLQAVRSTDLYVPFSQGAEGILYLVTSYKGLRVFYIW